MAEGKYKHIKTLNVEYVKNSDTNFTVKLNGLIVASMTIQPGEQIRYNIDFINISLESITCYDRREVDTNIRIKCFDWLTDTIEPVFNAEAANVQKLLGAEFKVTGNALNKQPYLQE